MRWLCIIALVAAAGCKKDDPKVSTSGSVEDVTPPPGPEQPDAAEPAPEPAEPTMLNKMKQCPSAVAGAHSTIEKGDQTIAVVVIGKDKPAVETIRERAKKVPETVGPPPATQVHDGTGKGGALGKCPSRAPGAKSAEVAEIENGVKITFHLAKPDDVGATFEMLNARAKELNARRGRPHGSGGGGGAGGGHGGHGSSGQGGNR